MLAHQPALGVQVKTSIKPAFGCTDDSDVALAAQESQKFDESFPVVSSAHGISDFHQHPIAGNEPALKI